MKWVSVRFLALVLVTEMTHLSTAEIPKTKDEQSTKVRSDTGTGNDSGPKTLFVRQTETTTTPKPKKARPSNLFGLISVLLTETREDASRAFSEIGTLFNGQFANSTTTKKPEPATSTVSTPSSSSESEEDNEITTTTEPFRITRDEFLRILRSNVQGIANLFGKEFRVAIRDSNQNVREFGRDLGNALRPYFNN